MKYKKFEVVELKDNTKATILEVRGSQYLAEIVNHFGVTVDNRLITNNDVRRILYSRKRSRER